METRALNVLREWQPLIPVNVKSKLCELFHIYPMPLSWVTGSIYQRSKAVLNCFPSHSLFGPPAWYSFQAVVFARLLHFCLRSPLSGLCPLARLSLILGSWGAPLGGMQTRWINFRTFHEGVSIRALLPPKNGLMPYSDVRMSNKSQSVAQLMLNMTVCSTILSLLNESERKKTSHAYFESISLRWNTKCFVQDLNKDFWLSFLHL